jgi:hypothetical protein
MALHGLLQGWLYLEEHAQVLNSSVRRMLSGRDAPLR